VTATTTAPATEPQELATPERATPADHPRAGLARSMSLRLVGLLVLLGALAIAVALSLAVGAKQIPLPVVWDALTHFNGDLDDHVIIRDLRLPRTVLGLLIGAALGVAGALIQALTRNPLADPGILGVNAGAGFAVTLAVAVTGITSIWGYLWFAFAGALIATVVVYAIGMVGRHGATPIRLTLAGVALAAVLGGISQSITLLRPDVFDQMRFWGAGSLAGRPPETGWVIVGFIAVGLVLGLVAARGLNAMALGDDLARSLGSNLLATRVLVVISVTLLAGAATAAAGPIGFVGLMVPHVVRWFVGPDQRWIIPYTAVGAPVLLLASDVIGRVVAPPGELQVGIVTAFVGAPVLIVLIRRKKASGL